METKNKVEKKNDLKTIIITMTICMLLFIPLGIFVGTKIISSESNKTENKENDIKTKNEEVEIDIDSDTATKAMESFNKLSISDEALYSSDSYSIEQISNYDLVASAVNSSFGFGEIASACSDEQYTEVSVTRLNENLQKYLKNKTINTDVLSQLFAEQESISVLTGIVVEMSGDYLRLSGPCDLLGWFPEHKITKTIKVTETEQNVYIYEKVVFAKYDFENRTDYTPPINYYKTYNNGEVLGTSYTTEESWSNNNSNINWDDFNTYKYTFKKDSGNYYFEKLELIID